MTKTHSGRSETSPRKGKKAASKQQVSAKDEGNPFLAWTITASKPGPVKITKLRGYYGHGEGRSTSRGGSGSMKPVHFHGGGESVESGPQDTYVVYQPFSDRNPVGLASLYPIVEPIYQEGEHPTWGHSVIKVAGDSADHVADQIRNLKVDEHPSWEEVIKEHPEAKLFAVECSPTSVGIDASGNFTTRARLIVHVPHRFEDGFETYGSMTVPSFVTGTLRDDGDITITEFRLSVNHPG